jgi:hypothetical protein
MAANAGLSPLETSAINKIIGWSKTLAEVAKPQLEELDVEFNGAGGVATTLTQANLDATPNLSGVTVQQVKDAAFALTSTFKGDITNAYAQLAALAERGS